MGEFQLSLQQAKDVEAAITMAKGVVLLRILAMKEKETATDLEMEVSMMVMLDARETLFVEAIIAFSLELISIPRMIAVRDQIIPHKILYHLLEAIFVNNNMDGDRGQLGQLVAHNVDLVKNLEGELVRAYNVAQISSTSLKIRKDLAKVQDATIFSHR